MPKLDALFDEVLIRGGSDLHVPPDGPALARVGAELVSLEQTLDGGEAGLRAQLSPEQRTQLERDHAIEIGHAHKDDVRFRGTYFERQGGLSAVFRVVPPRAPSLAELGCPEVLWRLADRTSGLVVVAGPARSGRSTTLAAMLDHVNKTRACHVLSIEAPIEMVYEPLRAQITQREVGAHAPSVEAALRNAARENADVVVAPELRTAEAVRLALRLASSGVAVFTTVQARGVVAALDALLARFSEADRPHAQSQLADALAGAVAQILVPSPDASPKWRGRAAVHEVLVSSPAVASAIREGKTSQLHGLMQAGAAQGMLTLDTALERLVEAGQLSAEEALAHAVDKEPFFRLAHKGDDKS